MQFPFSSSELFDTVTESKRVSIAFFDCLASMAPNNEARNVFAGIARDERAHLRALERLSEVACGDYLVPPDENPALGILEQLSEEACTERLADTYPERYYG